MKILVTGANGQLGLELRNLLTENVFFSALKKEEHSNTYILDICNKNALENFIVEKKISHIINCASYTQVDKAEQEIEKVFAVNKEAVKSLAEISQKYNIRLIHTSTDFVFSGNKNIPYVEDDEPSPLSIYGKSKLAGEHHIQDICSNFVILRTSWLYSQYKNNFVKTILKHAKEKGYLRVVYDQIGTPTYAKDLAEVIVLVLRHEQLQGIYHFSNEGAISWYDFAKAIIEISNLSCKIEPILTKEYPTLAQRPAYSVLNKSKIKTALGIEIPYWRESLRKCLSAGF